MRAYVLKRLAVFVPTLFLISVAVFGVINAVPAMPHGVSADGENAHFQESYRIFKRQFGLGLPVFLNLRHRTDAEDVERLLLRVQSGVERLAERAGEELDDLGLHAVPGLVAVATDPGRAEPLRRRALLELPRRPWGEMLSGTPPSLADAPLEEQSRRCEDWFAEWGGQFRHTLADRMRITFLETRFAVYLGNLLRLDFGRSMSDGQPVLPTLLGRLQHSLVIMTLAILLAWILSIPLGVFCAIARGRLGERFVSLLLFALYSLPTYFAATLLLRLLTIGDPLDWFPTGDVRSLRGFDEMEPGERILDRAHHLVLPVFCLTYGSLAVLSRYTRGAMLEVLGSDFVRTARAKGLSIWAVLFRHALRNALLPVLTLLGEMLPVIFSGAVIVEIVFDIPGMGSYIYAAILGHDYNAIMATTLIAAVLTLLGYLLSDLLYALFDPRIRLTGKPRS